MLIKKIKYTDYNGQEREEDFYFNLSKSELIKWLTTNGNYTIDAVLEKMIQTENARDMVEEFEFLIMEAYGTKSLDGKTFIKSKEVKDQFRYSPAYDVLFMELISDAKVAADFFNKVIPSDMADEVAKIMKENPDQIPDVVKDKMPEIVEMKKTT
jgi:hypothetical protein